MRFSPMIQVKLKKTTNLVLYLDFARGYISNYVGCNQECMQLCIFRHLYLNFPNPAGTTMSHISVQTDCRYEHSMKH